MRLRARLLTLLALTLCAAPAAAQSTLVGNGVRVDQQSSAPTAFTLGKVGVWSPSTGGSAGLPVWRKTDGTDVVLSSTVASSPLSGSGTTGSPLTCPTCVVTSGSYANPSWITSLAATKITGTSGGVPFYASGALTQSTNLTYSTTTGELVVTGPNASTVNIRATSAGVNDANAIQVANGTSQGLFAVAGVGPNSYTANSTTGDVVVVNNNRAKRLIFGFNTSSGTSDAQWIISNSAVSLVASNTTIGSLTTAGVLTVGIGSGSPVVSINGTGSSAPTFTTLSAGTRLILQNPGVDSTHATYGIGIETGTMWFGLDIAPDSSHGFKWYSGTTQIARLIGTGVLDVLSGLTINGSSAITWPGVHTWATGSDVTAVVLQGDAATSGTQTKDSDDLVLRGRYWNGSTSVNYDLTQRHVVSTTTPTSWWSLQFGGTEKASIDNAGNEIISGDINVATRLISPNFTTPTDGQVLAWSTADSRYKPQSISGTGAVTGTGTSGTFAKWSGTSSLANSSNLSEASTTVTLASGSTFTLTSGTVSGTYSIAGTPSLGVDLNANSHKITSLTQGTASADALAAGRSVSTTSGHLTGGGALTSDLTLGLPNVGPGSTTTGGGSAYILSVTTDAQGRISSLTTGTPSGTGTSGSGTANQLAYWSSSSALTSSANWTFDGTSSTLTRAAIGTAQTTGFKIDNSTAAANGAQQNSPQFELAGRGFASTGSVNQTDKFALQVIPTQGTTNSTAVLALQGSINGASYGNLAALSSAGNFAVGSVAPDATADAGGIRISVVSTAANATGQFAAKNSTASRFVGLVSGSTATNTRPTVTFVSGQTVDLASKADDLNGTNYTPVLSFTANRDFGFNIPIATTITQHPTAGFHYLDARGDTTATGAAYIAGNSNLTSFITIASGESADNPTLMFHSSKTLDFATASDPVGTGYVPRLQLSTAAFTVLVDAFHDHYSADSNGGTIYGRKARGTVASPTQALANDSLLTLIGRGYQSGGAFATAANVAIDMVAGSNFTSSSQETYITFSTTPAISVTRAERMRLLSTGALLMNATTTATSGTALLEVIAGNVDADPLVHIGNSANAKGYSFRIQNLQGENSIWIAGVANGFISSSSAGDAGARVASGKTYWIGTSAANYARFGPIGTTLSQVIQTTGSPSLLTATAAAHTTLTKANFNDWLFDGSATAQFATGGGTIAKVEQVLFKHRTYSAATNALTLTETCTVCIDGAPAAGTNLTQTTANALFVESGQTKLAGPLAHTGTTIGFYGTTPVAQYSTTGTTTGFTANTSANPVFNESTFTGNTGSTSYTISDVIRALKLRGDIAP